MLEKGVMPVVVTPTMLKLLPIMALIQITPEEKFTLDPTKVLLQL